MLSDFDRLYREHYQTCLRLAHRVVRDRHLAEDVVQDVFLVLCDVQGGSYPAGEGDLGPWLRTLVHHKAVDAVRRSEARRRLLIASAHVLPRTSLHDSVVHDAAWSATRTAELLAALSALPVAQRQVLGLAYAADLTQTEIARALGLPLGTVKTRTRSGLRRLRVALAPADTDTTAT